LSDYLWLIKDTYVVISLLVVSNKSGVPEVVETHRAKQDVGVIGLVVMADP